jgi:hypothetical protein
MEKIKISELKPFIVDGMPPLTEEERNKLKLDIQVKGVKDPIVVSEDFEVIDGNHRVELCIELGIEEIPYIIRKYNNLKEKKDDAITCQMARRNLTTDQRYWLIYAYWKEYGVEKDVAGRPKKDGQGLSTFLSQDEIGEVFGVHRNTVKNAVRYGKNFEYCQEHGIEKERLIKKAREKGTDEVIKAARKQWEIDGKEDELPTATKLPDPDWMQNAKGLHVATFYDYEIEEDTPQTIMAQVYSDMERAIKKAKEHRELDKYRMVLMILPGRGE